MENLLGAYRGLHLKCHRTHGGGQGVFPLAELLFHVAVRPLKMTHASHILLLCGSALVGHLEAGPQEKLDTGL